MRGRSVLVLGAGFSKPLGGPLMAELLDAPLRARSCADPRVLDALADDLRARRDEEGAPRSVEALFTEVWREARTGGARTIHGERWPAERVLEHLTNHLASVCGPLRPSAEDPLARRYVAFLRRKLRAGDRLEVLTFNYDPLAEECLRMAQGHEAPPVVRKLHGSATWGVCRGCASIGGRDRVVEFAAPYLTLRRPERCPACGGKRLEMGIVPPVHGKAGEARFLAETWRGAREALRQADDVLVVGYSLPPGDDEARSLMREIAEGHARVRLVCGRDVRSGWREVVPDALDLSCTFEAYLGLARA